MCVYRVRSKTKNGFLAFFQDVENKAAEKYKDSST